MSRRESIKEITDKFIIHRPIITVNAPGFQKVERAHNELIEALDAYFQKELEPAKEVYERFKHLDILFSDPVWMGIDDDNEGAVFRDTLYELWKALKKLVEE